MNLVMLPGATSLVTNNLSRFLARLDRPALEAVAQAAIDRLDDLDPDPELEDDDPVGQCDEDGVNTGDGIFYLHGVDHRGPGCPIADSGMGDYDDDGMGRAEYGSDQTRMISAAPSVRHRLEGTLHLRTGGRL